MKRSLEIFVDGACSGNPGPAAIGVVISENDRVVKTISQPIGQATNNIAEYTALIFALQEALILKASALKVYTDSELMCSQIKGLYKIKNEHLKPLFLQAQHLIQGLETFEISYIPREKNQAADKLATSALSNMFSNAASSVLKVSNIRKPNRQSTSALKPKQVKMVALASDAGEESPSSRG